MGNNGEYEEFYVVISIEGLPVPDFCKKFEGNYCLLGLETSTPILKLGDQLFRGEHQDVLGTDLLFDKPSGMRLDFPKWNYLLRKKKEQMSNFISLQAIQDGSILEKL
eukprot:Sdes_comp18040_c0_seq1m7373